MTAFRPANGRLLTPISTDGASANLLALRTPDSAISVSPANDGRAAEYVEKGKQLLIAATQRVLNLPEQRVCLCIKISEMFWDASKIILILI